jgi:dipeptidyl aminopeptidase/acylaminoacyl peptidase
VIDVASREEQQITKGAWRVSEFAWLPDGDSLLVSATDDPQPELETDALYSVNVPDGDMVKISEPMRPFGRLKLSPDGNNLAYVGNGRDGPNPFDLLVQPSGGGSEKNLTGSSIDRSISGFAWRNKSTLLASVGTGFETTFFEIGLDGAANALDGGKVPSAGSFVAGSGFVAFVGQNATQAPDIWILRGADEPKQVTQLNSSWNELPLVEIEVFRYPSFDGKEIEAALLRPDGSGNGPFPLVAMIHGGPSGRWARRFNSWGQLLVARGFAVFYPNIRGSTGYGHDFLVSNRRDWGGGDFKDVMAGIDHLVSEGIADPDRLGIGGWSYGGYMAAWAVTQTDRFKASIPGAPMTDLAVEYGAETAGINAYDTWYMGNPYEDLDLFMERSPTTHIRKVKTPTLILCGENDVIDPIAQCQQFHRGLKRFGVETEFVRYPREGHGIREEKHQLDLLNRVIEWYETHLE